MNGEYNATNGRVSVERFYAGDSSMLALFPPNSFSSFHDHCRVINNINPTLSTHLALASSLWTRDLGPWAAKCGSICDQGGASPFRQQAHGSAHHFFRCIGIPLQVLKHHWPLTGPASGAPCASRIKNMGIIRLTVCARLAACASNENRSTRRLSVLHGINICRGPRIGFTSL